MLPTLPKLAQWVSIKANKINANVFKTDLSCAWCLYAKLMFNQKCHLRHTAVTSVTKVTFVMNKNE